MIHTSLFVCKEENFKYYVEILGAIAKKKSRRPGDRATGFDVYALGNAHLFPTSTH